MLESNEPKGVPSAKVMASAADTSAPQEARHATLRDASDARPGAPLEPVIPSITMRLTAVAMSLPFAPLFLPPSPSLFPA